jgi:hypothetical protein
LLLDELGEVVGHGVARISLDEAGRPAGGGASRSGVVHSG